MKIGYSLLLTAAILLSACNKPEDPAPVLPTDTKALVDGQSFSPTENIVLKAGSGLMFIFSNAEKSITIKTNDTINGTYNIIDEPAKTTLFATITYRDASNIYKGTDGSVEITKKKGNKIYGFYNAKLVSDKGTSITIDDGSFAGIATVTLIPTETEINDSLLLCYSRLKEYVELAYIFDAVYSNTVPAPSGEWAEIHDHTQSQLSENGRILALWQNAYEIIRMSNLIIESAEIIITDESARNIIIAQAKAIRAYLFYELLHWFGEIPLVKEAADSMLPRSALAVVCTQIKDDATNAGTLLPVSWSGSDDFRIPGSFMWGLLARINLTDLRLPYAWPPQPSYPFNYDDAVISSRQIINSSIYTLSNQTDRFTENDPEIIWGFEKTGNADLNSVFSKGAIVPVLRLTEVYLIIAEAQYRLGKSSEALSFINKLNLRNGKQPASSLTTDDIFQLWDAELSREGSTFVTLRRFDKAMPLINNKLERLLLPVPLSAIISNPNLTQNIGY